MTGVKVIEVKRKRKEENNRVNIKGNAQVFNPLKVISIFINLHYDKDYRWD